MSTELKANNVVLVDPNDDKGERRDVNEQYSLSIEKRFQDQNANPQNATVVFATPGVNITEKPYHVINLYGQSPNIEQLFEDLGAGRDFYFISRRSDGTTIIDYLNFLIGNSEIQEETKTEIEKFRRFCKWLNTECNSDLGKAMGKIDEGMKASFFSTDGALVSKQYQNDSTGQFGQNDKKYLDAFKKGYENKKVFEQGHHAAVSDAVQVSEVERARLNALKTLTALFSDINNITSSLAAEAWYKQNGSFIVTKEKKHTLTKLVNSDTFEKKYLELKKQYDDLRTNPQTADITTINSLQEKLKKYKEDTDSARKIVSIQQEFKTLLESRDDKNILKQLNPYDLTKFDSDLIAQHKRLFDVKKLLEEKSNKITITDEIKDRQTTLLKMFEDNKITNVEKNTLLNGNGEILTTLQENPQIQLEKLNTILLNFPTALLEIQKNRLEKVKKLLIAKQNLVKNALKNGAGNIEITEKIITLFRENSPQRKFLEDVFNENKETDIQILRGRLERIIQFADMNSDNLTEIIKAIKIEKMHNLSQLNTPASSEALATALKAECSQLQIEYQKKYGINELNRETLKCVNPPEDLFILQLFRPIPDDLENLKKLYQRLLITPNEDNLKRYTLAVNIIERFNDTKITESEFNKIDLKKDAETNAKNIMIDRIHALVNNKIKSFEEVFGKLSDQKIKSLRDAFKIPKSLNKDTANTSLAKLVTLYNQIDAIDLPATNIASRLQKFFNHVKESANKYAELSTPTQTLEIKYDRTAFSIEFSPSNTAPDFKNLTAAITNPAAFVRWFNENELKLTQENSLRIAIKALQEHLRPYHTIRLAETEGSKSANAENEGYEQLMMPNISAFNRDELYELLNDLKNYKRLLNPTTFKSYDTLADVFDEKDHQDIATRLARHIETETLDEKYAIKPARDDDYFFTHQNGAYTISYHAAWTDDTVEKKEENTPTEPAHKTASVSLHCTHQMIKDANDNLVRETTWHTSSKHDIPWTLECAMIARDSLKLREQEKVVLMAKIELLEHDLASMPDGPAKQAKEKQFAQLNEKNEQFHPEHIRLDLIADGSAKNTEIETAGGKINVSKKAAEAIEAHFRAGFTHVEFYGVVIQPKEEWKSEKRTSFDKASSTATGTASYVKGTLPSVLHPPKKQKVATVTDHTLNLKPR